MSQSAASLRAKDPFVCLSAEAAPPEQKVCLHLATSNSEHPNFMSVECNSVFRDA